MLRSGAEFPDEAAFDDAVRGGALAICDEIRQLNAAAAPLEPNGFAWRGAELGKTKRVRSAGRRFDLFVQMLESASGEEVGAEVFKAVGGDVFHAVLPAARFRELMPEGGGGAGRIGAGMLLVKRGGAPVGVACTHFWRSGERYTYCRGLLLLPVATAAEAVRLRAVLRDCAKRAEA